MCDKLENDNILFDCLNYILILNKKKFTNLNCFYFG